MSYSAKDLLDKAKKIHDQELAIKQEELRKKNIAKKISQERQKRNKEFIGQVGVRCIENALKGISSCIINDSEIESFNSQFQNSKLFVRQNVNKHELKKNYPELFENIDTSLEELEEINWEINELEQEKDEISQKIPLDEELKILNDSLFGSLLRACSDSWHIPFEEENMIEEIQSIPFSESIDYSDNDDLFQSMQELLLILKKYKKRGVHDYDSEFESESTIYLMDMIKQIQPLEKALKNHAANIEKATTNIKKELSLIDKKIKALNDKKNRLGFNDTRFNIVDWSFNDDNSDEFPHISPKFLNWIIDNKFIKELFNHIEINIINKKKFCEIVFKEVDDRYDGKNLYFDNFLIYEDINAIAEMLNCLGYSTFISHSSPTKNDAKNVLKNHILKISW